MISFFFKLLILPAAHALILWYRSYFRKNVKTGDVVGIKFGEETVLNRTVEHRLANEVVVKAQHGIYSVTVKMDRVYLPDHREPIDNTTLEVF